jgi:drug/metabolite transporter (DMT)-like permease
MADFLIVLLAALVAGLAASMFAVVVYGKHPVWWFLAGLGCVALSCFIVSFAGGSNGASNCQAAQWQVSGVQYEY